ncbi:hypothetical protein ACHAP5_008032 [Fusarium lateritium]
MKYAYALTLCLSGMMGADAFVLPAGAAPKSGYALQRPNDNVGNQNAAGTAVKFSPNQGSTTAPKSGTVAGFIPVKGLGGSSKRHAVYMRAAQPDDDAEDDAGDDDDDVKTKSSKVDKKKKNKKPKAEDKKKPDDKKADKKTAKKADKKTAKESDDSKSSTKSKDASHKSHTSKHS